MMEGGRGARTIGASWRQGTFSNQNISRRPIGTRDGFGGSIPLRDNEGVSETSEDLRDRDNESHNNQPKSSCSDISEQARRRDETPSWVQR
jgi:hypothetical protein